MTFEEEKTAFVKETRDSINEAKKLGYNPTGFIGMIGQHEVIETARRLVNNPKPSYGYMRLWELKRLDLSVEALIQRFPALFTEEERQKARERLKKFEYPC
jgi:hypothetical protein